MDKVEALSKVEKFYVYSFDDRFLGIIHIVRNKDASFRKIELCGSNLCNDFVDRLNDSDLYYSNQKMSLSTTRRLANDGYFGMNPPGIYLSPMCREEKEE